jgi:hypothetical protein
VIDSFGGQQDSVVFLGRRSFRMELAGTASSGELGIPHSASEVPTERIFDSDRERAGRATASSPRPATGISSATSIALCSATFALGIVLTLAFFRPIQPRPSIAAAPAAPVQVAPPAPHEPPVVIELGPSSPIDTVAFAPTPARANVRRPLAKPAVRPTRPRAPRAVPADVPAPKPWVDPFAE